MVYYFLWEKKFFRLGKMQFRLLKKMMSSYVDILDNNFLL